MFSMLQSPVHQAIGPPLIVAINVGARGIVTRRSGEARTNSGSKKVSQNLRRGPLTQLARHKTYVNAI